MTTILRHPWKTKFRGSLTKVEDLGGGYCRDAEIFAVTLMNVAVEDQATEILCGLVGVHQVALNASSLSYSSLEQIAKISGLQSLVLNVPSISEHESEALRRFVPEVVVVAE